MRRCLRPTGETAPLCERWAGKMTFDNLRIRTKLNLFVLLVMVCVAAAGVTIAAGVKSELVSGRIDELRAITESAKGLAANLQDQVAAGGLTREQAEQAFARQLAVMTYDHGQGYVFAYRMDGVAVAAPDLKAIGTNRLDALFNGRPVIREIRDAVQNSGEAVIYYNFPRAGETTAIPKVSYAVTFPAWNLFLGTGAYIDDLTAKFHTAALAIGVGVGAMALLIGGAAWFVSQRISNPLGRLQACMRRLAAGEVDLDVPEMRRRDEVGEMAKAVQVFKQNAVERRRLEVETAANRAAAEAERERAATERAKTAEEQAEVVHRLGDGLKNLAAGDLTDSPRRRFRRLLLPDPPGLQRGGRKAEGDAAGGRLQRRRDRDRNSRNLGGLRRSGAAHRAAGGEPGGDRRGADADHGRR